MREKVQNINNFIEKIMKNRDFSAMLDDNNQQELDFYYELAKKLSQSYRGLASINPLPKEISDLKIALTPDQCEKLIVDFFESIGVSEPIIKDCLSIGNYKNLRIEKGLKRAYQKDGVIYLPEFTNTLGWLKTAVHEMAHYIRNQNTNGVTAIFGTFNEIEAKITEQAFYQYLVNSKQSIFIDENSKRPLNQKDIELQNLREMLLEQQNLFRFKDEYWFIKRLRNNLKENGTYLFKEEDYLKLSEREKQILANTFKWRENYLPNGNVYFDNNGNYSLHNGRHITNEFRFIVARLFSEYTLSNPKFLNNFGNYLLNDKIKDKESLDTFFEIVSTDDLIKNQITNYTQYISIYLTSILNEKAKDYLGIIKVMYGKDMSESQLKYLQNLQDNNCVVVDTYTNKYLNNQLEAAKNLNEFNMPTAHGSRVFNDDKIHFYLPAVLNRNPKASFNDIMRTFDSLLMHELLHFFIRPKANEFDGEKVSNFITEGLVDMGTRYIYQQTGKLANYQSNYGSNVIFVRQALANVSKAERGQLLFNSDIETFLKRTNSEKFNSREELQKAMTRTTVYDALLSGLADIYSAHFPANEYEAKRNSGLRQLYNLSASAINIDIAIEQIRQIGVKYYIDAMPKVDELIRKYKNNNRVLSFNPEDNKSKNMVEGQNLFVRKKSERLKQATHFATIKPEAENTYQKMLAEKEQLSLDNSVTKVKPMSRVLTKKENTKQNNNTNHSNNSGFISALLLSLGVGFISGVVSVLSYLFISRG